MALDLGSRRIGVAVSDSDERVATPVTVLARHRDRPRLHREIAELVAEWEAEQVVVGLPIDLAGEIGPAATAVLAECDELAAALPVPVTTHDERLTTRIADRSLRERGDLDGRDRRKVVGARQHVEASGREPGKRQHQGRHHRRGADRAGVD